MHPPILPPDDDGPDGLTSRARYSGPLVGPGGDTRDLRRGARPEIAVPAVIGLNDLRAIDTITDYLILARGIDRGFGRWVQVALLNPSWNRHPSVVEVFKHLGRLVAVCRRPGAAEFRSMGEEWGHHYHSWVLPGGKDLESAYHEPLPEREALSIIAQVALSVAELSIDLNCRQRCLTPRDIWLAGGSGEPPRTILVPSPAARGEIPPDYHEFNTLFSRVVQPGTWFPHEMVLDPAYTAPELLADPLADSPAAEVYSLGGILLRLLTGAPPVPGVLPGGPWRRITQYLLHCALAADPTRRMSSLRQFLSAVRSAIAACDEAKRITTRLEIRKRTGTPPPEDGAAPPWYGIQGGPGTFGTPPPGTAAPDPLPGGPYGTPPPGPAAPQRSRSGPLPAAARPSDPDLDPLEGSDFHPTDEPFATEPGPERPLVPLADDDPRIATDAHRKGVANVNRIITRLIAEKRIRSTTADGGGDPPTTGIHGPG